MIAEGSIDKLIAWLAEMGLNGAAEETLVTRLLRACGRRRPADQPAR